MASFNRNSDRFSMERDNTIRDIWQYTHHDVEGDKFDPQRMNEHIDYRRQIRKEIRPEGYSMMSQPDTPEIRPAQITRPLRRLSANVNLQKSLQLLDEAVGTPTPLLRTSKQTPVGNKKSFLNKSVAPFDLSSSFGGGSPSGSMVAAQGSSRHSFGESGIEAMTSFTSSKMQQTLLDEDVTTTNVGLLLEEDPGLAASLGVFDSFLTLLRNHPSEHQIFDLLTEYSNVCEEQVTTLKRLIKRATPGQLKFAKVEEVHEMLQQEKQTWALISLIFKDRLESASNAIDEPMMIEKLGRYQSEKHLIDSLFEKDSTVRQAQIVVDWLEQSAQETLEDCYDRFRVFTDQIGPWENTLHTLQQKKSGVSYSTERQMVDELDPDAPFRQKRPLADLDEEDELCLMRYLFACVRAGNLDKAQELCIQCGQEWRAGTLEGWKLYHDPNYEGVTGTHGQMGPVVGNPYRDIWKAVCWKMAEEEKFSVHERAIYAALSGNLKHLLNACASWDDYLWAYFKVFVDTRVEQEIRINSTGDHKLEELPFSYWDKVMSAESIFREIQSSASDEVRTGSRKRFHILQKYIILGDVDALIEEIYEWVKDDNMRLPRHLLRFNTHLILFLRSIGLSTKEELCVAILEAYVGDLIENDQVDLVAAYVAVLPANLQVEWYAKFLEGINESEQRKKCLDLATDAGLDVPSITKLVVENIRDKADFSMDTEAPIDSNITEEDQQKINAIDWLVFDPAQRDEAMRQANAVMRVFLAAKKLTATREVFNKLPPGSIDVIMRNWQTQTGTTELCAEDANVIREYLCVQAYLTAHDSFNDWFEHYHHARPTKPDQLTSNNFTDRVAHEHKEKQYQAELDRWQHTLQVQTENTRDKIFNVLLFVDGGWMVDQRPDAAVDECRGHQMTLLRQLCLPTMFYLLHTVLHSTGHYGECLQLADTIASEDHQLYKVFQRTDLQKFLQKLTDSSVALLDKGLDPLGYAF